MSIFSKLSSLFGGKKDDAKEDAPKADRQQAPKPEPSREDYLMQGMNAYNANQIEQAIALLTKAAELGENNAQNVLGIIYLSGKAKGGINYAEAARWFRPSADWGNPEAQFYLGFMRIMGHIQEPDMNQALQLLIKSASAGFPKAIQALEMMEAQGMIKRPG